MERQTLKIGFELKMVLDQETGLLENLLDVMKKENRFLSDGDTGQVFELNKSKELLILQHSYLDRSRRNLTRQLAKNMGLENSEPNLATLSGEFDEKLGSELRTLHGKLKHLVDEIQQLRSENSELIECSIRAVKNSWAALRRQFFDTDGENARQSSASAGGLIQGRI